MTTIVNRTNKNAELSFAEGDANLDRDVQALAAGATLDETDNRSFKECTNTITVDLPDASAILAAGTYNVNDYFVTIKNAGSGVVTVGRDDATDTIDGATSDATLNAQDSATFELNSSADGYNIVSKHLADEVTATAVNARPHTVMMCEFDQVLVPGETHYMYPMGADPGGITVDEQRMILPQGGTLKNLRVRAKANTTSSATTTITARIKGVNSSLAVVIPFGDATEQTDLVNTETITAGDEIEWIIVMAAGGTGGIADIIISAAVY